MTETEKLIQRHGLELNERGNDLTVPCSRFYTGSSYGGDIFTLQVPREFCEIGDWNNGYRAVWVNLAERAIFTYCEGDLDLTVDNTNDVFIERLLSAAAYYQADVRP
jgi:hypothetical protein